MENHDYAGQQQANAFKDWLVDYAKVSWWRILILVIFALISVFFGLLNPWPLKLLADSVFGHIPAPGPLEPYTGTITLLYVAASMYVIIYLADSTIQLLSSYIGARFGFRLDVRVKSNLFNHILHLPVRSSTRLSTGDYIYRQNVETGSVSSLILGTFVSIFQSALTVVGVLVILFVLDWELTLLCLSVLPFLYVSLRLFGPRIQEKALAVENVSSSLYTHVEDSIENADIVQTFNHQDAQLVKLQRLLNEKLHLQLSYTIISGIFGFITSALTVFAVIAIVIVGGKSVFSGRLTFGDLIIFVTYAGYLFDPLQTMAAAIGSMQEALASLKRVFAVVYDNADLENVVQGETIQNVKGGITFDKVNFSYSKKQILKDVNLVINAGEKIGFIGPSGAGKSTLLSLLLRFAAPDSGFISIDGHESSQVNIHSWREQIALVDQEPKLFSITIGENIAYARPNEQYPLPDIMAAAYEAYATEFIDKLPNKYDQLVERRGGSLSGGQKQRIAIARALFKKAPILVLDEPTSAQDVASEKRVLDAINHLMNNRTVLLVTHKLSLLSQMDKIYVVESGQVQDVKAYGGLDAYIRYMNVHETG